MQKIIYRITFAAVIALLASCGGKQKIELPEGVTISDGPAGDSNSVAARDGKITVGDLLINVIDRSDVETWVADEVVDERRIVSVVLKSSGYWIGTTATISMEKYSDGDMWVENITQRGLEKIMASRNGQDMVLVSPRLDNGDVTHAATIEWIAPAEDELSDMGLPETTVIHDHSELQEK